MCDTVVALGNVTADGATILGKNSDREPNEAHHLLRIPAAKHPPDAKVKCTYLELPQVGETHEVILAKPFWIWGAEMGANEHGVAIGNEAVFTKVPYEQGPGLTGMDLLRLALERARTARAALDVITGLLAEYGQGGNCGFKLKSFYHNSYLIADPGEAWVLESAGRQWAAEQVKEIRTISNGITIGGQWDLASPDLVNYAIDRGWCRGRSDFDFARCYSNPLRTRINQSGHRRSRTKELLSRASGSIDALTVMNALRDHGQAAGPAWSPARAVGNATVCWHAGTGPLGAYQTTGSMVSHLAPGVQTHYCTGTAAPCTSIFKPVWLGADLPDTGPAPTGEYDEATIFWRHETLHRSTLRNYRANLDLYGEERDAMEKRFVEEAAAWRARPAAEQAVYETRCFAEAAAAEERWKEAIAARALPARGGLLYKASLRSVNRRAKMPGI